MAADKIKSFTDLIAWQEGHKIVINIYRVTEGFPKKEIFGLTSQMRRCAVSITSNVAEGFSRKTNKDKINFYHTSLGSLTELQNQLLIDRDVGFLNEYEFNNLANQTVKVQKILHGLKKALNT